MNGDYQRDLDDCLDELNKIKDWIDINSLDSNVRFLVSYSIVKACGTIEIIFKKIIFDYLARNTIVETENYLTKMIIDSSCNPKPGIISNMLEQINVEWKNEFEKQLLGAQQKGDLKSLVNVRNDFAHGRNVTATIGNVITYYTSGIWVIDKLYNVIYTT